MKRLILPEKVFLFLLLPLFWLEGREEDGIKGGGERKERCCKERERERERDRAGRLNSVIRGPKEEKGRERERDQAAHPKTPPPPPKHIQEGRKVFWGGGGVRPIWIRRLKGPGLGPHFWT